MTAISRLVRLALLLLFLLASLKNSRAQAVTILHHFQDGTVANDGATPYGNLIQGSDGYFYGTTYSGGSSSRSGTIFKVSPQGTLTILHQLSSSDGESPCAALVQAADGNFYGITQSGGANLGTAFRITASGQFTVLHNFADGTVTNDGQSPSSSLIQASDGNLYGVTSLGGASDNGTVFEMTTTGSVTILH
ncbi:MAG TPA: choice-of-anchor tandem repeat GloVer-containing protein, partial [Candidatus Methylacidiphilales bacterium]|nr:choice-of-anchor tandem repeat GloVer-containing protein [Candidatus Methylacidiphilales bacterium]